MHKDYNSIDVTTQLLFLEGTRTQNSSPKLRRNAEFDPNQLKLEKQLKKRDRRSRWYSVVPGHHATELGLPRL